MADYDLEALSLPELSRRLSVRIELLEETAESEARGEIEDFVTALGPYEFQELVAAMLRGMGYSTPYVAARGPDGGTDILAYPDPLGPEPRMCGCR